jgi:hypothetical protein
MHMTYKYAVPRIALGTGVVDSIAKCAALQAFSTPAVIFNFFCFMGLLQRKSPVGEIKQKYLPTYRKHLKFMSLPVFLSTILPYDLRAAYMSSCQIPWNAYLSWMKNRKVPETA